MRRQASKRFTITTRRDYSQRIAVHSVVDTESGVSFAVGGPINDEFSQADAMTAFYVVLTWRKDREEEHERPRRRYRRRKRKAQ